MGKIISDEGGRNLINYKYRGGDFSLIYKYLLTPLNEFILAHLIPLWLAPNLITLIGLAATVVSHVVAAYYSPTFSGNNGAIPTSSGIVSNPTRSELTACSCESHAHTPHTHRGWTLVGVHSLWRVVVRVPNARQH